MDTAVRRHFLAMVIGIPVVMLVVSLAAPFARAADIRANAPAILPDSGGVIGFRNHHEGAIRRGDRSPTGTIGIQGAQAQSAARPSRPPSRSGLPTWTGSFQRDGVTYWYTMIGTDPSKGPATTIVKTLIIPLRFEYPAAADADFGGVHIFDASTDLVDGRTAIDGILKSPIFTPYPFVIGGVKVGTTQFGDAFQRANFWGDLGPLKDYHVLLKPTVAPTQTIVVPVSAWWEEYDSGAGIWRPLVTESFLEEQIHAIDDALGVPPDTLPIFVTGPVEDNAGVGGAHCCRGGPPAGSPAYIWAAYESSSQFGGYAPDTSILGHEILEWLDHPQGVNDVAGWAMGPDRYTDWCVDRILEVGDPLEDSQSTVAVPLPGPTFTYHVPDAVFVDFFTHRRKSRSTGGLYSLFGNAKGPSAACLGDTVYQSSILDVPGAYQTVLTGINDSQDIVGYYFDQSLAVHGFVRRQGRFLTIDVPGAVWTNPSAINRAGQIDGYYSDGAQLHAFLLSAGGYQTLDFPGASYTFASNINSWGDVVGGYGDSSGIQHGFVYRHGRFATVDAPLAVNSSVSGINDSGDLAINGLDANFTLVGAYVRTAGSFTPVRFPGDTHDTAVAALDNQGRVAGTFATDWYGFTDGFATQSDGSYVRLPQTPMLNGMNNRGQVVGSRDGHGFIATLPLGGR